MLAILELKLEELFMTFVFLKRVGQLPSPEQLSACRASGHYMDLTPVGCVTMKGSLPSLLESPHLSDRSLCPFMHRYSVPCSHSWKSRGMCAGNDKQFVFIAAEPKVGIPVISHQSRQSGGGLGSSTPWVPP